MMWAERKAWSNVIIATHKKVPLKQALKEITADSLFWQIEVLNKINLNPKGAGKRGRPSTRPHKFRRGAGNKGSGRHNRQQQGEYQDWGQWGSGRGRGKGYEDKGRGRGYGKGHHDKGKGRGKHDKGRGKYDKGRGKGKYDKGRGRGAGW